MSAPELSQRTFFGIISEDDADRVWSCVANGVRELDEGDDGEEDEE